MQQKAYTVCIACNDGTGPFVFIMTADNDAGIIQYAEKELGARTDVEFILLRRGNALATDAVFWDSRRNYVPELSLVKSADSRQSVFEDMMQKLGILPGTMALHANRRQYLNPHIQWMWEQFLRNNKG